MSTVVDDAANGSGTAAVVAEPVVTVLDAPAPEAAPAIDPTDRRALVKQAFVAQTNRGKHAVNQPRVDGKFAGPPQLPAQQAQPVVPVGPTRPAMPKAYKLEHQKHWDAIPQEFAAAVHQRELDAEKGIVPLKQRAQEADELLSEFKPYEMLLKAEGSTPKQAIGSLLQTAALFRTGTPVQKAQSVAGIIRQFGIPLELLQQALSGQTPPQPAIDPQYSRLAQTVEQLQQQQLQQEERRSIAAIQEFASHPEHVHFDVVQERMLALLSSPHVLGVDVSTMTDQQKLKVAYDTAIRLDPALSAQAVASQQAQEQTVAQVQKANNAAVQVKGAPASGPAAATDPTDRRATIKNAMARANR